MSRRKKPRGKVKSTQISGETGNTHLTPIRQTQADVLKEDFVPFGDDNLFPQALAHVNLHSGIHRGILANKRRYKSGKGFRSEDAESLELIKKANDSESLKEVASKYFKDFDGSGNAYLEIVTNANKDFVSFYHHDYTTCRVGANKKKGYIIIHPDWKGFESSKDKARSIPIYPEFEDVEGDGVLRSMIHVKDYEPRFTHYGVPEFIGGLNAAYIAYKTDKWNLSRLDNGYRMSGVLLIDGEFASVEAEQKFDKDFDDMYTNENNRGKLLKVKKSLEGDNTKLIPFPETEDADWTNLHKQSKEELVIAHQWFPSLAGLDTSNGFDSARLLNEYQVAMSTSIEPAQEEFLDIIKKVYSDVLGVDLELDFENKPPIVEPDPTMFVWEVREQRGLPFDENDPNQQMYYKELELGRLMTTPTITSNE